MTQRRRLSKINRKKLMKKLNEQPGTGSKIWFPVVLLSIIILFSLFYPEIKPLIIQKDPGNFSAPPAFQDSIQNLIPEQKKGINETGKKAESQPADSVTVENKAPKPDSLTKKTDPAIVEKKDESSPKVSCQILNGCGETGISARFKTYLEDRGHTVNSTGNYISFRVKHSFIISQIKSNDPYILAEELNISRSRVQIKKVNSSSNLIFVIGKDYKRLSPFKK